MNRSSLFSRTLWFSKALWSLSWGLVWVTLLHPIWRRKKSNSLWVIGGHRGRHYGDNSAAVEAEARRQGKDIVWIANRELAEQLRARGIVAVDRHSLEARKAISTASLLIYSHGEDDLDLQLILMRGRTATRVYVDHCMGAIKGGGIIDPTLLSAPWPVRAFRTWLVTRWDYVLCVSEEVRRNHRRCYPMNPMDDEHAPLSGGAHLDEWQKGFDSPPKQQIYWFPTFRETTRARSLLHAMIQTVVEDARLKDWLERNSYRLLIGTHINSKEAPLKLSEPFSLAPLQTLTEDARDSELYISDYSGTIYDFLLLERPQILFAFDLADYQKRRYLFGKYEARDFALHARTAEELILLITSEAWRSAALHSRAVLHRGRSLPPKAESYARLSVNELSEIHATAERNAIFPRAESRG